MVSSGGRHCICKLVTNRLQYPRPRETIFCKEGQTMNCNGSFDCAAILKAFCRLFGFGC